MPRTKVVVRNLPPDLSMAAFVAAVDEVGFPAGRRTWHDYVPGKAKAKLVTPSVAYVGLVDEAAVFDFNGAFAGRCFADDKGKEWRATVEYAPYQRVPRGKAKLRHEHQRREGTIEKDREYQVGGRTRYPIHTPGTPSRPFVHDGHPSRRRGTGVASSSTFVSFPGARRPLVPSRADEAASIPARCAVDRTGGILERVPRMKRVWNE